jgi:hypothetical protein
MVTILRAGFDRMGSGGLPEVLVMTTLEIKTRPIR